MTEEEFLNLTLEDLEFGNQNKGLQYQLAIKRSYIFQQPYHLERIKQIAKQGFEDYHKATKRGVKDDEEWFENFLEKYLKREVGGTYYISPGVTKYIRETRVTLRNLFQFGIDKVLNGKRVGNFARNLFLEAVSNSGMDIDNLKKKTREEESVFKKDNFTMEAVLKRLQEEGTEFLASLPPRSFTKDSTSAQLIKIAFANYYKQLKDDVTEANQNGAEAKVVKRKMEFIGQQVEKYEEIVSQKLEKLSEINAASGNIQKRFEELDSRIHDTDEKFHHGEFAPQPKAHLNPREKELR